MELEVTNLDATSTRLYIEHAKYIALSTGMRDLLPISNVSSTSFVNI